MRLRSRNSPLLLLLIPGLVAGLAVETKDKNGAQAITSADKITADGASVKTRHGTDFAPVDGKDGMPHQGPWVDKDKDNTEKKIAETDSKKDLPPLKGRPSDPTIIDGKKIPETNDGVMDDKTRQKPKEGTTGTEGGVSEKDKARKAQEGRTGGKVDAKPVAPKEQPPLPHSEQEKILSDKDTKKDSSNDKEHDHDRHTPEHVAGLEKPAGLPEKLDDKPNPIPSSAHKDHLDLSKSKGKSSTVEDAEEGVIQPFHSFILSLTMILVSEVGDKTFLVAALMAMKHDRMVVFSAAFGALLVMTVLSAVLGHAVPTLIPKRVTSFLAAGLFFVFGAKMLREGLAMDPNEGVTAELHEVERELAEKEKEGKRRGSNVSPYALEMGLNDRKSRSKSRFPSPPRSPSTSPSRSLSPGPGAVKGALHGLNNLLSLLLSPAWVQTFVMTFLGEWGDRSQIATIAMAAGQDYWWVTFGATFGHCICTGVAVIGGRAIAGRVSLKVVTVGGAVAFLVFGFIYFAEAFYA
ncbi:GCR1-dependent translation factor 1 [Colletotrichum trifolii]|uniref:GCR1-dependent translation factor 1 n=1 Tax=Colletotrichum trifolii TaxID=5466 RepID=A0A4R8R255_COLTR|nr:GCR1-dependent translation factor 1 [Colletotrichum trifolii]